MNFSNYQTTPAIPEASSMIETFRAIGYSIETAVADIIDNSISANAKNIWINFDWKGSETWLAIKDDGAGMNNDELINAMRPGSKHPLEERKDNDLGRFGLGLKTASFSQCRKLSVISKQLDEGISYWTWDLDFVNKTGKWELIKYLPNPEFENELNDLSSGTLVVWNDIDRLVKGNNINDSKARNSFLSSIEKIEKHISMVFHRFLESGTIKIIIQERIIKAWNPFMLDHAACQSFPVEPIFNGQIKIKGYVLPHRSKLGSIEYDQGKGPKNSWTAHQGFYIYRNNRLLVAGEWIGLFKRELHYDLCRIQIELPNSLDTEWQIDIKKSIARPPAIVKEQIISYSKVIRERAIEVYRHRGKILKRSLSKELFIPVWVERINNGKRSYEINRTHPFIAQILDGTINKELVSKALSYIEETIPVQLISLKESEQDILNFAPFEKNTSQITRDIQSIYISLISKGNSVLQAKRALYFIEPFDHYPEIIENIEKL